MSIRVLPVAAFAGRVRSRNQTDARSEAAGPPPPKAVGAAISPERGMIGAAGTLPSCARADDAPGRDPGRPRRRRTLAAPAPRRRHGPAPGDPLETPSPPRRTAPRP